jgi:hypothetical protein
VSTPVFIDIGVCATIDEIVVAEITVDGPGERMYHPK